MHLPRLDGDNYGITVASRNACTLGHQMEHSSAPLPAKVDQKLTSLSEAEADLNEVSNGPPAHVRVAQRSTEERKTLGNTGRPAFSCLAGALAGQPAPIHKKMSLLHSVPNGGTPTSFFFFFFFS